jgi:competence/damage-inducible protein CinA-like protein
MPSAEIITIGTEILLGEIVDTNARDIARKLRDAGIDLYRKTTVGDNVNRISMAIQQAMERCEVIITTGGLGPTVDDPTRQAVAQAIGVELEYRPELWRQIKDRFKRFGRIPTENNKRQAYIPAGATAIENAVGTAPSFLVESSGVVIISLPGVPREMEYLMDRSVLPYLKERFSLRGLIKSRILHTVGVGESQIDDLIGDLEILSNPTVGLAAHSGQVDVRVTVKADSEEQAREMLEPVELELRGRLGDWIYGSDEQTLELAALQALSQRHWTLAVVEYGIGGSLINRLSRHLPSIPGELLQLVKGGEVQPDIARLEDLPDLARQYRLSIQADVCLGAAIRWGTEKQEILTFLITPMEEKSTSWSYGGPPDYAVRYAVNNGLDLLRKLGLGES